MRKSLTRPVYDSYWVKPDKILAGQYPCGPDETEAQVRFHSLLKAGVTFFPDLTEKGGKQSRHPCRILPDADSRFSGTISGKYEGDSRDHWQCAGSRS